MSALDDSIIRVFCMLTDRLDAIEGSLNESLEYDRSQECRRVGTLDNRRLGYPFRITCRQEDARLTHEVRDSPFLQAVHVHVTLNCTNCESSGDNTRELRGLPRTTQYTNAADEADYQSITSSRGPKADKFFLFHTHFSVSRTMGFASAHNTSDLRHFIKETLDVLHNLGPHRMSCVSEMNFTSTTPECLAFIRSFEFLTASGKAMDERALEEHKCNIQSYMRRHGAEYVDVHNWLTAGSITSLRSHDGL